MFVFLDPLPWSPLDTLPLIPLKKRVLYSHSFILRQEVSFFFLTESKVSSRASSHTVYTHKVDFP